jgi:hypothetical protein
MTRNFKNKGKTNQIRIDIATDLAAGATREDLYSKYPSARARVGEVLARVSPGTRSSSESVRIEAAISSLLKLNQEPTQANINKALGRPEDTPIPRERLSDAKNFRPVYDIVQSTVYARGFAAVSRQLGPVKPRGRKKPRLVYGPKTDDQSMPETVAIDDSPAKIEADLAKTKREPVLRTPRGVRKTPEPVERTLVAEPCRKIARELGCYVVPCDNDGYPDDIILYHKEIIMFAEYKRPTGGQPSDLQNTRIQELRDAGFCARIFNIPEKFRSFLEPRLKEYDGQNGYPDPAFQK